MDTLGEVTLEGVKKIILVLSGKGGVGKSTVTTQLALSAQQKGLKVGVLDIDLCGPSIPRMLGVHGKEVHQHDQGWLPVYSDNTQTLGVMSIGFLLSNQDDPVVWRGPKKTAMIRQFLTDVNWGGIDLLVVDTPPGTSDEHIAVMESLKNVKVDGAVLVTTPQGVAVGDVRREITFCKKTGLKILGIVENMSGYVCPNCSECTNIFSSGGGKALAEHSKVPFLGSIPIEPGLALAAEEGNNFISAFSQSETAIRVATICSNLLQDKTADDNQMEIS